MTRLRNDLFWVLGFGVMVLLSPNNSHPEWTWHPLWVVLVIGWCIALEVYFIKRLLLP